MRAYKQIIFDDLTYTQKNIANPTIIAQQINHFLTQHKLQNAYAIFGLTHPHIQQKYITRAHATPKPSSFLPINKKHKLLKYEYVYPLDTHEHVFYTCSINQPLLLQYKLLATHIKAHILAISTKDSALLNLYRHIYGRAFRKTQLALDMKQCNNNPDQLLPKETIRRIVQMPSTISTHNEQENLFLLISAGLFFQEQNNEAY